MERRKFEDSFQEAFKDAEVNPSENVWTNIELDLEKAEGDKMKRRLFFFKTLAAASVVFAMCVGGIGYYIFQYNSSGENLAQEVNSKDLTEPNRLSDEANSSAVEEGDQKNNVLSDESSASASAALSEDKDSASRLSNDPSNEALPNESGDSKTTDRRATQERSSPSQEKNKVDRNNQNLASKTIEKKSSTKITDPAVVNEKNNNGELLNASPLSEKNPSSKDVANNVNDQNINVVELPSNKTTLTDKNNTRIKSAVKNEGATTRELPLFYQPTQPELQLPKSNADPGMLLLAKLADEEKGYAKQKSQKSNASEKLWTAVGFAAGGFNANNPSVAAPQSTNLYSMNSANTATKQSKASGVAYSLGVSVGTKLSERWVLQGGINYLTQSSDYTANSVIVVDENFAAPKAESLNAFAPQVADASARTTVAQTFPYNVNNNVRFVSVPVQAGYLVINKKFGLQLNAGVSTDLFLQNTITPDGGGLTKTTQGRGDESPYRSLNFSGLVGTELSYKLGYRYRVSLNPGLRYPFNSVYKSSTGIDAAPLTFDVGLRFRYIFH